MLALYEKELSESKTVSIRYDRLTRTYYCFYHITNAFSSILILSYDLNQCKWSVDTNEYDHLLEKHINDLFDDKNIPFGEQIRYVIDYLDTYTANQLEKAKMKTDVIHHGVYSLSWLQRFRGMRRWISEEILGEQSLALQRYSALEKSTRASNNEELISVKALAESFYSNDIHRNRKNTCTYPLDYSNEYIQTRILNKAPAITELWLDVSSKEVTDFKIKLGHQAEEEKLKKLAEKFVTYFGGTFQCNVGYQYQLEYDYQTWYFTVLKVEFLTKNISKTKKIPKTKIVFLIHGIPHYVRG